MTEEEEVKIAVNKINELIYEMFLKDLKSGNISKEHIKSYGKVINKRNVFNKYNEPTLFNYGK